MQILKLFFFLSDISSFITICFSCHVFVICIDFYHFFPRLYDSRICSFYLLLFVLHFPSLYIIIIKCFLLRCYDLISCILYCCSTYSSFHRFIGNVTSVTCVVPLLMSFSCYLRCQCDQVLEKTFSYSRVQFAQNSLLVLFQFQVLSFGFSTSSVISARF